MTQNLSRQRPLKKVEPTTGDILEALLDFSGRMDQKFERIDTELVVIRNEMEQGFISVRSEITDMRNEIRQIWTKLDDIDKRLTRLEQRTIEDSDVEANEILDLKKQLKEIAVRVQKLEKQKESAL